MQTDCEIFWGTSRSSSTGTILWTINVGTLTTATRSDVKKKMWLKQQIERKERRKWWTNPTDRLFTHLLSSRSRAVQLKFNFCMGYRSLYFTVYKPWWPTGKEIPYAGRLMQQRDTLEISTRRMDICKLYVMFLNDMKSCSIFMRNNNSYATTPLLLERCFGIYYGNRTAPQCMYPTKHTQ